MSLSISNLQAGYGKVTILQDISIAPIQPGAFVGLIGPNAAGKSTLFKSLTGLAKTSAGSAILHDASLLDMPRKQRARQIAYMPQKIGCNAALTVFESVLLALKQTTGWRVKSENLAQVAQTLEALDLTHLSNRGLSALSGGQSQMVAAAQALVRKPKLLLLDEPTSALDLHHQLSILTKIRQTVTQSDMIAIAALHDLNLAAQFCDRLLLINNGKLVADGEPKDILKLDTVDETYRVNTALETTKRGTLYVEAFLN